MTFWTCYFFTRERNAAIIVPLAVTVVIKIHHGVTSLSSPAPWAVHRLTMISISLCSPWSARWYRDDPDLVTAAIFFRTPTEKTAMPPSAARQLKFHFRVRWLWRHSKMSWAFKLPWVSGIPPALPPTEAWRTSSDVAPPRSSMVAFRCWPPWDTSPQRLGFAEAVLENRLRWFQ